MAQAAVVVTGAAGLIGFAVSARLARAGRATVGTDCIAPREEGGFRSVEAALTDVHKLHEICAGDVAAIVHCGAVSGPMLGRDNPRAVVESNVAGTANLLEIARQRGARLVFCSSTSAYGNTPPGLDPVPETAPLAAADIYGATKAAGDILARAYAAQTGLDAIVLRFSWVYGPRRRTPCVLRAMIRDAQAGRPTRLPYGRGFTRQYVHVDDAVSAVIAALDAGEIGPETLPPTVAMFWMAGPPTERVACASAGRGTASRSAPAETAAPMDQPPSRGTTRSRPRRSTPSR